MRTVVDRKFFILLFIYCVKTEASKCPETRKPHVTSCTIFYNCINLPGGGYVWAPAKCSEGLVFQPYLRICVLPGDSWTCDNLSSDKILGMENHEKSQLINPSQMSYKGYEEDVTSLGEDSYEDSSHTIVESSELNNLRPAVTPYPLIETYNKEKIMTPSNMKDTISDNYERVMENIFYQFFTKTRQRLDTRLIGISKNQNEEKNKFTLLRGIIDRILLYENNNDYEESTICHSQNNLMKNSRVDELNKNMLKYLVQSYILGTRNPTRERSRKKKKNNNRNNNGENNESSMTKILENSKNPIAETSTNLFHDDPIDSLINGSISENNIIVIEGNLGEKEYVTIDKYKSLSNEIKVRVIELLPCAKGVRLSNLTDCTKYYTCDPETARVVKFSCSSNTAFNDYTRICDIQRYKTCSRQLDEKLEETTLNYFTTETEAFSDVTEISEKYEPCRNTGKFVDSDSDKHYYVCYSSQANPSRIESLRMTCPNDLIFCQDRRVCSTRKRCYDN